MIFDELSFPFQSGVDFSSVSITCNPFESGQNSSLVVSPSPLTVMQFDIPLFQSPAAASVDPHSLSPGSFSSSPAFDTSIQLDVVQILMYSQAHESIVV